MPRRIQVSRIRVVVDVVRLHPAVLVRNHHIAIQRVLRACLRLRPRGLDHHR